MYEYMNVGVGFLFLFVRVFSLSRFQYGRLVDWTKASPALLTDLLTCARRQYCESVPICMHMSVCV